MSYRPIAPNEVDEPIICSPFAEPTHHWHIARGLPPVKAEGRRPASNYYRVPAHHYPGFIAVLASGWTLLIEIKGRYADDADLKAKAAQRWVAAVNCSGDYCAWQYSVNTEPPKLMLALDEVAGRNRGVPELGLA
jgi:hypothetical protein